MKMVYILSSAVM